MKRALKKVAILGAGLSGLIAGNVLRERGFDVTVYERRIAGGWFKELGFAKFIIIHDVPEVVGWLNMYHKLERANVRMGICVGKDLYAYPEYLKNCPHTAEIINLYQFKRGASCMWVASKPKEPSLMSFGVSVLEGRDDFERVRKGYRISDELVKKLAAKLDIVYTEVKTCEVKNRTVTHTFGRETFDAVVSTVPLPEFCDLAGLAEMRSFLEHYPTLFALFYAKMSPTKYDWIYYPYTPPIFYRATLENGVVCTETAMTDRNYGVTDYIKVTLKNAEECFGEVALRDFGVLSYGYLKTPESVAAKVENLKKYLERHCIYLVGKYAEWCYNLRMEHAYFRAKKIAEVLQGG